MRNPRPALLAVISMTVAWTLISAAFGQVMGEEAELERLQHKAEEAIANDDADGAAMNMGKAALMAGQLASRQKDAGRTQWYRGAESLFLIIPAQAGIQDLTASAKKLTTEAQRHRAKAE